MKISIVAAGPGGRDGMTLEALRAVEESGAVIGAERLLAGIEGKKLYPLIAPDEIARAARECGCERVCVLMSGDVGFYSGAKRLYPLLDFAEVEAVPGVSSLVSLCAKLRTPWEDVFCVSAHGREHNAPGEIQRHRRTFVLTGGNYRAQDLARELTERGYGFVRLYVGENLSYPDERIVSGTAEELMDGDFKSLAAVLAENGSPVERPFAAPHLADSDLERGRTPMTKEEVRAASIAKLRIEPHHTVWDVGAGTGSVSVEAAFAAGAGRVFAIERCEDAAELIERNRAKFGLYNISVVRGAAPEALAQLPAPDRVFVGGSAGRLEEIMRAALEKNPRVRFVVNSVTLETLGETARCFALLGMDDADMVQFSCTRVRRAGRYHMMDAQNPVWVMSGEARHG